MLSLQLFMMFVEKDNLQFANSNWVSGTSAAVIILYNHKVIDFEKLFGFMNKSTVTIKQHLANVYLRQISIHIMF